MKTYGISHGLSLVDLALPIRGFEQFISIYVLEADQVALFDVGPAVSIANLLSGLRELHINPADVNYIFISHIHIDHAGGIGRLLKEMPRAKVVVHKKGGSHLIDPAKLWANSQTALGELAQQYEPVEPVPANRIIIAQDGMLFNLGEKVLQVMETPGHATHHMSFWDSQEKRLFAGEACGIYFREADFIKPSTPLPFNLEQAVKSLERLIQLSPDSLCYAHFGSINQPLANMEKAKQQLILWGKVVAGCLDKKVGHEEIYRELCATDALLAKLDNLPCDRRDREIYFMRNSIAGFVGYFNKFGTGYLNQL